MDERDDEQDKDPMQEALEAIPCTADKIATQLRMMATGEAQYQRFMFISPWIKNIWNAAADYIEHNERQKLH